MLKALDGQGWTTKLGAARGPSAYRELVDGSAELAAWSPAVDGQNKDTRTAHRTTPDMMALCVESWPALGRGVTWAVSGWAGMELAAPFATTTPALHVYVADQDFAGRLSSAIEDAGLSEVDEGGRVTFWRADHRVFKLAGEQDGLPVVSAPRL